MKLEKYSIGVGDRFAHQAIVGNVGLLATLLIGYVGSLFVKRLPDESIEGLTLFTLKQIPDYLQVEVLLEK